jgi:uncharacterized protein YifE (UPF0438 family)
MSNNSGMFCSGMTGLLCSGMVAYFSPEYSTLQDHLHLLKEKGRFIVDCSHAIFHPEELKALEKYGHWFQALSSGVLQPISEMQKEFIKVANHEKTPITTADFAWFKYQGRKSVEAKFGDRLKTQYHVEEDTFYNREMAKKQKRMMSAEVQKNHLNKSIR